jgi:hypothetical protein
LNQVFEAFPKQLQTSKKERQYSMKAHAAILSASLMLAASTASIRAQTETASNVAPSTGSATTTALASLDEALRSELEQLKQLVHEQQQRIEALEAARKALPEAPAVVAPAVPLPAVLAKTQDSAAVPQTDTAQGQNLSQAQTVQAGSSDERIRNLERQIKGLGPISFSGDIRLRGEPFFGGPSDESLERARARVRARFNTFAALGSQFRAGLSLASGDINDPTTTNQTLTGFYTRKAVGIDQAFVEFTPDQFKNLTLVGGKFRYPWFNTELTWDKDLNPEGAAETLGFKLNTPALKKIALIGFQLPFAEVAGTASSDKRTTLQITYGGQMQTQWQLARHVTLGLFSGYYDFRGTDSIALALARANSKNPQTPFTGAFPLGVGNPVQDSTYTTTATTIITVGGTVYPTGVTSIPSAQFASKFGLFDNLARLDIDTGHAKFPISFIGDYVQNTEACSNLAHIIAAPANTSITTYKQTLNAPCKSNERRGYWAEGRVGRLQEKGDFQFGYTRIYIEREAVLGNFNYSDIRQGTNVSQHRFDAFYQFDRSVQLGITALVGRPLATTEPWLTRLQFDTVYIF